MSITDQITDQVVSPESLEILSSAVQFPINNYDTQPSRQRQAFIQGSAIKICRIIALFSEKNNIVPPEKGVEHLQKDDQDKLRQMIGEIDWLGRGKKNTTDQQRDDVESLLEYMDMAIYEED